MRRGAALPAVLFATAITSALAVGGAYVARQQATFARLGNRASGIQPIAEEALVSAIANWDTLARAQQAVGTSQFLGEQAVSGTVTRLWVTKSTQTAFWLVAESKSEGPPALRRRVGLLVQGLGSGGTPRPAPQRAWADLP